MKGEVKGTATSKRLGNTGVDCVSLFDVEYICGFVWWGVCKQSRWRHNVTEPTQDGGYALLWQRYDNNKMADMCYYGSVMITTRWWLCVTMETLWQQQDGGYELLWQCYDNNKMADMCYYGSVMITTRWWLCVTMETLWQQRCPNIQMTLAQYTHLQQQKETERVIDVFYIFNSTVIDWTCYIIFLSAYHSVYCWNRFTNITAFYAHNT